MTPDVLRYAIAVLAMLVVGAALTIAVRYLRAAWWLGRAPGRILARHVGEVALGTSGLALGYAAAVVEQLGYAVTLTAVPRLWLYLVSMALLLIGMLEVGAYQRTRARHYPHRQEQVRARVRAGLEGRRITGPRGADRAAIFVANEILALEGTPLLPEPTPRPTTSPSPADLTDTQATATYYGRHALGRIRRRS